MTTLATDGKSIASDGQVTSNYIVSDTKRQKVFRLDGNRALGVAGCLASTEAFRAWLVKPDAEKPTLDEEFLAVVIDGTDKVTVYDHECRKIIMPVPYCGGSGKEVALGAMLAGATPKDAVRLATKVDVFSGGLIREVKL